MSTLPLREAAVAQKVPVRLAQVDQSLRLQAAEMLIELMHLSGVSALVMRMLAEQPQQNPEIEVPIRKYSTVIINKKFPPGKIPDDLLKRKHRID